VGGAVGLSEGGAGEGLNAEVSSVRGCIVDGLLVAFVLFNVTRLLQECKYIKLKKLQQVYKREQA